MSKVLRVWMMSLDDLSHVRLECPEPLTADELEDTLAFLDIARKQIARFALPTSKPEQLGSGPIPSGQSSETESVDKPRDPA